MGNIYHEWDGTTLIVTSDSGTSSCDLKGSKGDMGIRGPQGEPGIITDALGNSALATQTYVDNAVYPKLDKRNNGNGAYPEIYQISINNGQSTRILQSIWQDDETVLIGYSAAQRDQYGCIQVGTPIKNCDAANKKYVDNAVGGSSWQAGYVAGANEYIVDIEYDEDTDGGYYAVANNVHLALWGNTGSTPVIPMLAYIYYDGYTEDCLGTVSARFQYDKSQDESSFLTMNNGMYDAYAIVNGNGEHLSSAYSHNGTWTFNILASKM